MMSGLHTSSSSPAFVLTMASHFGTLAAARCLGDRRVPVIMADAQRLAPALWSRHVLRRARCPPVRPVGPFMDWLLAFGARDPGHVLYATCDDLAWMFADHEAELRQHFRLFTPPFATMARLLDKRALYAACGEVGLRTPVTWFPRSDDDLEAVAREARFPLIIKPRTQVLLTTMQKGAIVRSPGELREAYRAFMKANRYDARMLERVPDLERPMLQEFCGAAGDASYALSGFCDSRQRLFVTRAAHKLVQWPRSAGLGICFRDAPLDEALAQGVRRLCELTGLFGVFEAEFVTRGDESLLIDFNPRFFGQMGFDVARGLPSPYLVYLDAVSDLDRLQTEVDAALAWQRPRGAMFFINRTSVALTRAGERIAGRAPTRTCEDALTGALNETGTPPVVLDFAGDRLDLVPRLLDSTLQILWALRNPRAFLRMAARGE
jgi:D-aspartate ligase